MRTICILGMAAALTVHSARADQLEDAYKAGYAAGKKAGYEKGYAEGSSLAGTWSNTTAGAQPRIVFPGTKFSTTIDGDNVLVSPDSSIAIIPNKAMGEIEQRLGKDFLSDNNVLLNNGITP